MTKYILLLANAGEMVPYIVAAAALAAILTFVGVKFLDRLRLRDAESQAKQLLAKADQDRNTKIREADLEIKERALKERPPRKRNSARPARSCTSASGRSTSGRTLLEQQADQLRKQEKMVESNQRKLAEKLEDANRRQEELDNLLDLQRQTLHQLSGLSREEAKRPAARTARAGAAPRAGRRSS